MKLKKFLFLTVLFLSLPAFANPYHRVLGVALTGNASKIIEIISGIPIEINDLSRIKEFEIYSLDSFDKNHLETITFYQNFISETLSDLRAVWLSQNQIPDQTDLFIANWITVYEFLNISLESFVDPAKSIAVENFEELKTRYQDAVDYLVSKMSELRE